MRWSSLDSAIALWGDMFDVEPTLTGVPIPDDFDDLPEVEVEEVDPEDAETWQEHSIARTDTVLARRGRTIPRDAQLEALTATRAYQSLSRIEREKLLDVWAATDEVGRWSLLALIRRDVWGRSALLDRDGDGRTMLCSLHALATSSIDIELLCVGRARLLGAILGEVGAPNAIGRAGRAASAATAMHVMLCRDNPAEYARIMVGLVSPRRRVRARNGATIEADYAMLASPDVGTTISERVFRSAMMRFTSGAEAMSALFGRELDYWEGSPMNLLARVKRAAPASAFVRLRSTARGLEVVVVTEVTDRRVSFWSPCSGEQSMTMEELLLSLRGVID